MAGRWLVISAFLAVVVAVALHLLMGPGFTVDDIPSMKNKTVIILGAESGVGPALVGLLVKRGCQLTLVCNSMERCHTVANLYPEEWDEGLMTLTSWNASISRSARNVADHLTRPMCENCSETTQIDFLINNLAVMGVKEARDAQGWERHLSSNYLSQFVITYHLRKLLRQSQTRIVTLGSVLSHLTWPINPINTEDLNFQKGRWYNAWLAYAQSKRAVLWFTHELNRRLADRGASVVACRTGVPPFEAPAKGVFFEYITQFMNLFTLSAENAALPIVYAMVKAQPGEYVGPRFLLWGPPAVVGTPLQPFPYPADDAEMAKAFWDQTVNVTEVTVPLLYN